MQNQRGDLDCFRSADLPKRFGISAEAGDCSDFRGRGTCPLENRAVRFAGDTPPANVLAAYTFRSGAGAGAGGGGTGVGTSVDGPLPGAMVIFSPLASSG